MPMRKRYKIEIGFEGYITLAVEATTDGGAFKKARAEFNKMSMRAYKPKHGPEVVDDFVHCGEMRVDSVERADQ